MKPFTIETLPCIRIVGQVRREDLDRDALKMPAPRDREAVNGKSNYWTRPAV
jgi:hypothetical protein